MSNENNIETEYCTLPDRQLLDGKGLFFCYLSWGKPASGKCEDCLIYKQVQEKLSENAIEKIVHQAFHDLASKYKIDVDIIANIIEDYNNMVSPQLKEKLIISNN